MTKVLVCLHGWDGTKESFTELREALKGTDIRILTPDLPGFGTEPEPEHPWNTDDFADWVEQWLSNKLTAHSSQPIALHLLGHSHGGRIALKLAWRQSAQSPALRSFSEGGSKLQPSPSPLRQGFEGQGLRSASKAQSFSIEHLYLCAAAGIRHSKPVRRSLGLFLAKIGKAIVGLPGLHRLEAPAKKLLYKLFRVHDYERASPLMRETMIRVSAEDIRPLLREIRIPTDIFWGKDDTMTPFSDALLMEKEIRGSVLSAFPGVRHRVHRDRAKEIAAVISQRMT